MTMARANNRVLRVINGVVSLPDVGINGSAFKCLLPLKSYGMNAFIDEDFVLKNDVSSSTPFTLGNTPFTLTSADSFEVVLTVRSPSFGANYNTVLGSTSNYYNNISIDFANSSSSNLSVFIGIPRSGHSTWYNAIVLNNLALTANKWYTIKVVGINNTITGYITDDNGDRSAAVSNDNLYADSVLQLRGVRLDSNKRFRGDIDLKKSYIKKNGVLFWGMSAKNGGYTSPSVTVNYNGNNIAVSNGIINCGTTYSYISLTDVAFGSPLASDFSLQLRFQYVGYAGGTGRVAFIGVVPGTNYRNLAFHYDINAKQYWIGFPKLNNSGWNVVVNWKNHEFKSSTWYKIRVDFVLSSLTVKVYIDDILEDTATLPENSSFPSSGVAFGTNIDNTYRAQMNIDTNGSFLRIGNERVW